MNLQNLYSIGHIGNFVIDKYDSLTDQTDKDKKSLNLYSSDYEFTGTQDIFMATPMLQDHDGGDVSSNITSTLQRAHNFKMVSFGLDGAFELGMFCGLPPSLDVLSVFKYIDASSLVSGLKIPAPVVIPLFSKKGR